MQDNQANLKAIIYCRVSDQKQVSDGNGLHSQERMCREYAKRKGYRRGRLSRRGRDRKTAPPPQNPTNAELP